jgi:DNA-binding transcriptional regulator PaaX
MVSFLWTVSIGDLGFGSMAPTTRFSPREIESIEELEAQIARALQTRSAILFDTREGIGTPDHLRDEVWDEVVRRANNAAYIAERSGEIVMIRRLHAAVRAS